MIVVVQRWEESERGWGVRPDGYSIHPDIDALTQFQKEYWATMPDETPDEYSRISGYPYYAEVDVNFDGKSGIRYWDNKYPEMKMPQAVEAENGEA